MYVILSSIPMHARRNTSACRIGKFHRNVRNKGESLITELAQNWSAAQSVFHMRQHTKPYATRTPPCTYHMQRISLTNYPKARAHVHVKTHVHKEEVAAIIQVDTKAYDTSAPWLEGKVCSHFRTSAQQTHITCTHAHTRIHAHVHTLSFGMWKWHNTLFKLLFYMLVILHLQTPQNFWKNVANQRRFMDWLAKDLGFSSNPLQWYTKSGIHVREKGGASLLLKYVHSRACWHE